MVGELERKVWRTRVQAVWKVIMPAECMEPGSLGTKRKKFVNSIAWERVLRAKKKGKRSKRRYQDLKWLLLDVNTRTDALHTQAGSSPKYIFHLNYTKLVTSQKLTKDTLLSKILTSLGRIWGWFLKPWHCQEGGMGSPMSWHQDLLVDKSPPKVIIYPQKVPTHPQKSSLTPNFTVRISPKS